MDGARHHRISEPLCWTIMYPMQWREPSLNLAELAKLRWVEGWSRKQLAEHYGKSVDAISNYFQEAKKLRLTP